MRSATSQSMPRMMLARVGMSLSWIGSGERGVGVSRSTRMLASWYPRKLSRRRRTLSTSLHAPSTTFLLEEDPR